MLPYNALVVVAPTLNIPASDPSISPESLVTGAATTTTSEPAGPSCTTLLNTGRSVRTTFWKYSRSDHSAPRMSGRTGCDATTRP